MKYYITDKVNVITQLSELLDKEVIEAMDNNTYMVEEVEASYPDKKFKVLNENDVFKAWVRILPSNRITVKYARILTNGTNYALPILEGIRYYDVNQKVIDTALQYGQIVNVDSLPDEWVEYTG